VTKLCAYDSTYSLIRATADVSGQPPGTSAWGEIITSSKRQRFAAPAIYAE
jgi:hypothetical protein